MVTFLALVEANLTGFDSKLNECLSFACEKNCTGCVLLQGLFSSLIGVSKKKRRAQ